MRVSLIFLVAAAGSAPAAGQSTTQTPPAAAGQPTDDPALADLAAFEAWLGAYKTGAFRMVKDGETDLEAIAAVEKVMAALARFDDLTAGRKLFEAAWVSPVQGGEATATERMDFYRETQPWRVHDLARRHLAALTTPEIETFLIERVNLAGRDFAQQSIEERTAAMRALGERKSLRGLLTILKAAKRFPGPDRVRAINVLSQYATLETVPSFLGLLDDKEPNARIAALNGLARALQPHTDETVHAQVEPPVAKARDAAVAAIRPLLLNDKVWQVRAAAREALVGLRSKSSIPVLIDGLDAELKRTKDPWSLDVRLHDALERMTGVEMPPGKVDGWRDFWRKEGRAFEYVRAQDKRQAQLVARAQENARYRSFFKLSLDSDRVLFVVDLSGSMREPVSSKDTAAGNATATKHKLVMDELKKIVMAIPDGGGFNLVAFSDRVQIWRASEMGKPMLVKIDDRARDELLGTFLDSLQPNGPTNLYAALDAALDFAGSGVSDKYYDVGFDTMYVLSDGAPSYGEVTDRDEILKRVRETNALRRITINCVTFGDKNETEFLAKLAEENGGRHVHIE
ncbi:MAG: HEAT repeat domain-containing protein [Planctomycetota bacterium]